MEIFTSYLIPGDSIKSKISEVYMKQHLSKVLMLAFFALLLSSPCLPAQAPSPAVVKAAQQGLMDFCAGTSGTGTLQLGMGFQVHTVNPLTLVENTAAALEALAFPMDMWRFIVLENGKPIGLLTVAGVNREWQAVSFGGAELSVEIANIRETWPAKSGFTFRFIRVYQATSDFMEIISGHESLGFAPLKSARVSLGIDSFAADPGKLLYNSDIVGPLKDMVSKAISTRPELNKEK
jgi:hypothetical protein